MWLRNMVQKWGVGGKGVRESNGRGCMEQNKIYPHQGYTEKKKRNMVQGEVEQQSRKITPFYYHCNFCY
jgi:hypothetical protein